jgi:hypothetical protein
MQYVITEDEMNELDRLAERIYDDNTKKAYHDYCVKLADKYGFDVSTMSSLLHAACIIDAEPRKDAKRTLCSWLDELKSSITILADCGLLNEGEEDKMIELIEGARKAGQRLERARLNQPIRVDHTVDEITRTVQCSICNHVATFRIIDFDEKLEEAKRQIKADKPNDRPFKCPVCDGTRRRVVGLFTPDKAPTEAVTVECTACKGTGIVWRPA